MKHIIKNSRGFTLIELLVVIAIIAVLSVAVILTLNPAELLKQARDSTRVSDLSTLKSAVSLYLADVTPISIGTNLVCYSHAATTTEVGSQVCLASLSATSLATTSTRTANGAGWLPVNFTAISSGAPIGNLPADPSTGGNNGNYYYTYITRVASTTFEMAARAESVKYSQSGSSDITSTDGGNNNSWNEQGTDLSL